MDVDKLDIDKIKPVLDNLYKISNVVEKEVVKKAVLDKLIKTVNDVQTIVTSN